MRRFVSTFNYLGITISGVLILSLTPDRIEAAESATIEMETQALNLDNGVVSDSAGDLTAEPTGADVLFSYHADWTPHAVVWPAVEGIEFAFIDNVSFNDVSVADMAGLSFSAEPLDLPLETGDTVVVLTDTGAVYKLGNAMESAGTVTISYEQIQ